MHSCRPRHVASWLARSAKAWTQRRETLCGSEPRQCCEYCRLPEHADPYLTFHLEHIIARQHGGEDEPANLAWSCSRCNHRKGTNLSSRDPDTGTIVELFHPRRQTWRDHFAVRDALIVGLTPSGRATVQLLDMNDSRRIRLRSELLDQGQFPAAQEQ